jgi:hypothetical protein
VAGLLAGLLVKLGFKWSLSILCTVPALILSFISNLLEESAIFCYKDNKLLAYSIINKIAKTNRRPPITIDLSQSSWLKYDHYRISLYDALSHPKVGPKLRMSFLFMLAFFFNNRLAQISLDDFTNEYLRGMLMNCTSAVATITVIILITRYQVNRYTYFAVAMLIGSLLDVVIAVTGMDGFLIESAISIAIRYLSDLSYCLFLIYTIETFPTVCRTQCLAFALTGSSVGVILAYTLSQYRWAELVLGLLLNMLLVVRSKDIQLDYENKLRDTLKD